MKSLFSIDVEDWFHILDTPAAPHISEWSNLTSRVERNFFRLMEIFDRRQVKATLFFLGWIAQKYPALVKAAQNAGHEIASHGYNHRLVYEMSRTEFYEDILKSKKIIEDVTGCVVQGYRSPGFSADETIPWFLETIIEAGHIYDSSFFPAPRSHGGLRNYATIPKDKLVPHCISVKGNRLIEFPVSVVPVFGKPVCFFGGGYLRLFPFWLINKMAHRLTIKEMPIIWYLHPREIDPHHPRLKMSRYRQIKTYINIRSVEEKLEKILDQFQWVTFSEYIESNFPQEKTI